MNTKINQNINVGVDTGNFQLDIYNRPLDIYFTVPVVATKLQVLLCST